MTDYENEQYEGAMVIFNDERLKQALTTLMKNGVDIMQLLRPALNEIKGVKNDRI